MVLLLIALVFTLGAQGIPTLPSQGGTIRGTLRHTNGKPAAGVRVSVTPRPGTAEEIALGASLSALTESDEQGRYILENIPPGKYLLVAGRLDLPTYFPGVSEHASASIVDVVPGGDASGLDFVLLESSVGRAGSSPPTNTIQFPLQIEVEGGNTVPIRGPAGSVAIRFLPLTGKSGAIESPFSAGSITVTQPFSSLTAQVQTYEFAVTAINLPDGYVVKSLTFEQTDLTSVPLKVSVPTPVTNSANLVLLAGAVLSSRVNASPVHLILARLPSPGLRVLGHGRRGDVKPIYMSGRQATIFADGSFEFTDVAPGRHVIALVDLPGRAMGATVVVEKSDVTDIQLDDVLFLPSDLATTSNPVSAGALPGGSEIPTVAVRAQVVDEIGQPVERGRVFVSGPLAPPVPLQNGEFVVQNLLPGRYQLDIEVHGYQRVRAEVVVDIQDVAVKFVVSKN